MECIERCLKDLDAISTRVSNELENIFDSVQMVKDNDGVYKPKTEIKSNIDVQANIALAKWWHFQWFLNLQVKLFGRCIIY